MGPSDFYLFGLLNKNLAGKRFAADTDVKQAVTSWLQKLYPSFFYARIQALVLPQDK
jgi:hypothetical protein